MSTTALTGRLGEASSRFKARMAGVFQLLEAITAGSPGVFILPSQQKDKTVKTVGIYAKGIFKAKRGAWQLPVLALSLGRD